MASACELVLAVESEQQAQDMAKLAIEEVQRIENKYSRYQPQSIVSHINAAAGLQAVQCDEETQSLLDYANTLYQASDGLFDITSGVLRRVWDFKNQCLPTQESLDAVIQLIGWHRVEREGHSVRLPECGMELDFGGFGKEYAADRAGALLAAQGLSHGYVNLAGDMRVLGPKPDGQPWVIGIQDPRVKGKILATLPVDRGGLATSGDYERFFEMDGRRYCHVMDPRSGQPVTHWRSVSVLAPLAVVAGNCTTITMLKQADGLEFLEVCGVTYLAVDHNGVVHGKNPSHASEQSTSAPLPH